LLIQVKKLVTGEIILTKASIIGAINSAVFSLCLAANILGVISQKIRTKKAVKKVATSVPILNPNIGMKKAVTMADMAILTKLFPINIAAMNLSILEVRFWILFALLIPFESIWRSFILLNAITAVSEAAKINEATARTINNANTKSSSF